MIGVSIAGIVGANFVEPFIGASPEITPGLEMKAEKANILKSENAGGIVSYSYKSGMKVSIEPPSRILEINPNITTEEIGLRTSNTRFYRTTKKAKDGAPIFSAYMIAAKPQYYRNSLHDWEWINYATTTEEVWLSFNKPTLSEKLAKLIGVSRVIAGTVSTSPNAFSVDGQINADDGCQAWQTYYDFTLPNGSVNYTSNNPSTLASMADTPCTPGNTAQIIKSVFGFPTQDLADNITITSSTLSIRGTGSADSHTESVTLTTTTPTGVTTLTLSDYNKAKWGKNNLSDSITVANWNTSGYNRFLINDLTVFSLTASTTFGLLQDAVFDERDPGLANGDTNVAGYYSEASDPGNRPFLLIDFTEPVSVSPPSAGIDGTIEF